MRSAWQSKCYGLCVRGPNRRVGDSSSQLCVYRLVVLRDEGYVTQHAFENVRLLFVRRAKNKISVIARPQFGQMGFSSIT